jgi:hypothetical protein
MDTRDSGKAAVIRSTCVLALLLVVSVLASAWLHVSDLTLVLAVVWPAAGIVAGVLIGAVAFVVQSMPSIQEKVIAAFHRSQVDHGQQLTPEQEATLRGQFTASMKHIRQNVSVVLAALAVLALSTWWAYADLPFLSWPLWSPFSKLQAVHAVGFFMFCIVLYAVWDTLQSMFLLSSLDSESATSGPKG